MRRVQMNDMATVAQQPRQTRRTARVREAELLERPFAIQLSGVRRGRFDNLFDAINSARIAKREHPLSRVAVEDLSTGQIVLEIELT
jgi:hypothetical protein